MIHFTTHELIFLSLGGFFTFLGLGFTFVYNPKYFGYALIPWTLFCFLVLIGRFLQLDT
jgi:hypothetical protein